MESPQTLRQGSYTRSWAGAEAPRDGIRPRFYMEAVQDELASAREGRPIFREEERVELFMPGNGGLNVPVMRVTNEERMRWPQAYDAFRRGIEAPLDGTPLEEWPALNRAQVRELKALDLHTIEDVAVLSDLGAQRGMGLRGIRDMAKAFLSDAERMAMTGRLSKENDDLKSRIAALENQVKELGEITQRQHGELMGMRNAPNAIASAIPGLTDPMQQIAMQAARSEPREQPQSSLAAFNDSERAAWRRERAAERAGA